LQFILIDKTVVVGVEELEEFLNVLGLIVSVDIGDCVDKLAQVNGLTVVQVHLL
jgi:hypothetical protein